jgi:hypothetical protein
MAGARYRMMFSHQAHFGLSDLRRITMAVVFAADEALVPSHLRLDPSLDEDQRLLVQARTRELYEIGALRTWEVENAPDPHRSAPTEQLLALPSDQVIDTHTYLGLLETVEEQLVDYRHEFLPATDNFEGITEFTLGKQTLCKIALAEQLQADRLLIDRDGRDAFGLFLDDLGRYERFEEPIIEQVVEGLALPDVSVLDMADIERCRRLMPAFRDDLLRRTSGRFHELGLADLTADIAASIVSDFTDTIAKRMSDPRIAPLFDHAVPLPDEIAREALWDLLQLLVKPVVAAKYMRLITRWYRGSRELGPLLLLLRLHRLSHRA